MQNASLIAAGDGFTLVGYESGQVRWARVSRGGALTHETAFVLPAPVMGPYFAVATKTAPADQLIAIALYPSATVLNGYDLQAFVQDLDATTAAEPVLLDKPLPAGTDPRKVRITAGAARSGNRGFVAWGVQIPNRPIQYLVLGANAATVGSGTAFGDWTSVATPAWDCLAATNGPSGLGFSIVGPDNQILEYTDWVTSEMDDAGVMGGETTYGLKMPVADCHILGAPAADGAYDLAFEDSPGIGAAFSYAPRAGSVNGTLTAYPMVIPAGNFEDPASVPHVAWAAPAGLDMTIGLSRPSGPYVVRYTFQAVPHGSALSLRSVSGRTGPVSASVGPDYVYVTYTDQIVGSASADVLRYFVKVEASAQLP
jgi:hypothetical protein